MKGRRTEIDELNGLIVRKGNEIGCPAPTHQSLVDIVKQVERGQKVAAPELLYEV